MPESSNSNNNSIPLSSSSSTSSTNSSSSTSFKTSLININGNSSTTSTNSTSSSNSSSNTNIQSTTPLATNTKLTNSSSTTTPTTLAANINNSTSTTAVVEKPTHYTYLKEFRVEQCSLFLQHKCTQHRPYTCFYWHFKNQRRRRPIRKRDGTFNYNPDVYCDKYDEQTGVCANGDDCPYVHRNAGDTEKRYHLRYYKTATCIHETDSKGHCTKNGQHCAFAHGQSDLRPPVYDIRESQGNDLINERTINLSSSLEKERLLNEDPKWNETNYVLINYKTEPCKRPPRLCRQGFACPQYHNSRDKRRNPNLFKYRSTPCPNVKQGDDWLEPTVCENGDNCKYCHSRTEQQFHPEIYKSSKCNDMVSTGYCPRGPFCAFAHLDNELKTQRTHSTSESSDYTLENYITNVLPSGGKDGDSTDNSTNSSTNRDDSTLFNNNNNNEITTGVIGGEQLLNSSPVTTVTIKNDEHLLNGDSNINSVPRPIGSEREDLHNLKNKVKLNTLIDDTNFTLDTTTSGVNTVPTAQSTPSASTMPIGSQRPSSSLHNQINSNFNQNLLTLSTNVIVTSASSSPQPSSVQSSSNTNYLINKTQQLQRSTSQQVQTTPSTQQQQQNSNVNNNNNNVTVKYSSLFTSTDQGVVDMITATTNNAFDFVNNTSFIDKELNSNDTLASLHHHHHHHHSHHHHQHHHPSNLIGSGNSSLPIQIPNSSNLNLYGATSSNNSQNDFNNYVNASPLNPLANSLLTQQLTQSITKPSSLDASFLAKSSQSNKQTVVNATQSDLLQNHYSTNSLFFDTFNSATNNTPLTQQQNQTSSATSSVVIPPSSQSPHTHNNHINNNNNNNDILLNYEKLKQDFFKEKQNNVKLERNCNDLKQFIERFQKETNEWKNKFFLSEHEKAQESQKYELIKKKLEAIEQSTNLNNTNVNGISNNNNNSTNNNNNNSNNINNNNSNSNSSILNLKLYLNSNNNIKTFLPNDIDKISLENLQSLYITFKNDLNKLDKILNEKKQHQVN